MEHVSQACLFLEDAGDLGQALNRDVDEMSMDEQVRLAVKTSHSLHHLKPKQEPPSVAARKGKLRVCGLCSRHGGVLMSG